MKNLGAHFGSREPREPHPLPCLTHNLNHVSVFFLTLRSSSVLRLACSCACASLYLRTLALTTLPARVLMLAYQHTWFCLLLFHSTVAPIILLCSKFFHFSLFSLLSFFDYPFHLPDFLQPACFSVCLRFLCVASASTVTSTVCVSWS